MKRVLSMMSIAVLLVSLFTVTAYASESNIKIAKPASYIDYHGEKVPNFNSEKEARAYVQQIVTEFEKPFNITAKEATLTDTKSASSVPQTRASSSIAYGNRKVRSVTAGIFGGQLVCRVNYSYNTKTRTLLTAKTTTGLEGNTFLISWRQSQASATILGQKKSIKCFGAGYLSVTVFVKGIGEIYTQYCTTGGTVYVL